MALVPYTNTGNANVHLDGKTILPGETREIDETQTPGFGIAAIDELIEDVQTETDEQDLSEALRGTVKEVLARLPDMTDEQLSELEALEGDEIAPRKGVLDGINKEQLTRANKKTG